jgi:hypothetical protein
MDEIKLFRTIPKVPATNTVEEFNRMLAYSRGGARAFDLGWMTEGDLPEEEDSTYERVPVLIKYRCANGETPAEMIISEAIPCQAAEDFGSAEGVETREPSSNGNAPHECPTSGLCRMMI